jgi:hypothetical protein
MNVEYYSAIKNETTSFAGRWIELEIIQDTPSKISQAQKDKYHIFAHM